MARLSPDRYVETRQVFGRKRISVKWRKLGRDLVGALLATNFLGVISLSRITGRSVSDLLRGAGSYLETVVVRVVALNGAFGGSGLDNHAQWLASTFGVFAIPAAIVEAAILVYIVGLGFRLIIDQLIKGLT
jgi:hypothetical protein